MAGVTAASRFIPIFFFSNEINYAQNNVQRSLTLVPFIFNFVDFFRFLCIFFRIQFFVPFFCCDISLFIIFLGSRRSDSAAAAISDTAKFCYFLCFVVFFTLLLSGMVFFFRFGTFLFKLAFFHCVLVILGCLRMQLYGFV